MVYKGQEVKVQSARVLDPLDDSSREVESLEGKARANLVADSHDFKPPQEKIKIDDRMAEIVGQPVELKKPDGSVVQLDGGFVSAVSRGDRSVSIQYHRDDNNEVKLNAQGKPIIDKITIRTRGIDTIQDSIRGSDSETVIDFTKGAKDNGVSELAKHLRVVQSGDNIGDVMIASADNKKIKTLHTNFSTTTSEVVVVDAKDVVRIKQLVKDDGSSVRYNYNDLEQPFKYNQVIEQYQASNGSLVSKISDRIGGSEKFVTHGKSGENPTWRTDLKQMDDGRLAYKDQKMRHETAAISLWQPQGRISSRLPLATEYLLGMKELFVSGWTNLKTGNNVFAISIGKLPLLMTFRSATKIFQEYLRIKPPVRRQT